MDSTTSRKKRTRKATSSRQMQMELVYHDVDGNGAGDLIAHIQQCSSRRNAQPAETVSAADPNPGLAHNADPMPVVTMAEVYDVAAHARADSTRTKYGTQWQGFHDFCAPRGFPPHTAGAALADGAIAQYAEERRQGRKQSGPTRRGQSRGQSKE